VQTFGVVEPDFQGSPPVCDLTEEGTIERQVRFPVSESPSGQGEASTNRLLVRGMHIVPLADVERHGHASICDIEAPALAISNEAPVFWRRIEARDLDKQEGKIALTPLLSPIGDERGEEFRVEAGAVERTVGLPLIPKETLDGIGRERRDHTVIEAGRDPRYRVRVPGVGRFWAVMGGSIGVGGLLGGFYETRMGLHIGEVSPCGEGGHKGGVGGEGVEADPGIDGRPSPG